MFPQQIRGIFLSIKDIPLHTAYWPQGRSNTHVAVCFTGLETATIISIDTAGGRRLLLQDFTVKVSDVGVVSHTRRKLGTQMYQVNLIAH